MVSMGGNYRVSECYVFINEPCEGRNSRNCRLNVGEIHLIHLNSAANVVFSCVFFRVRRNAL